MKTVLHLMGPTCAGKSTILKACVEQRPDVFGVVEVGKMLRAKYGEAYFKGQAAPEHTQDEAWQLYLGGVRDQINQGKRIVLVDGQPRDVRQARAVLQRPHGQDVRCDFLMVHASEEVRERRARETRTGDSLELALQRMRNDYRNCYVAWIELLRRGVTPTLIDTGDEAFNLEATVHRIAYVWESEPASRLGPEAGRAT